MGISFADAQEEYIDDNIPPALLIDEADLDPVVSSNAPPSLEVETIEQAPAPEEKRKSFELSIEDLLGSDGVEADTNSDGIDPTLQQLNAQAQPGLLLEKTRKELEEEARIKAYELAIQSLLPLRPMRFADC